MLLCHVLFRTGDEASVFKFVQKASDLVTVKTLTIHVMNTTVRECSYKDLLKLDTWCD